MKSSPKLNGINHDVLNFQNLSIDEINSCLPKKEKSNNKDGAKKHLLVLALFCGFIFSANYYSAKNINTVERDNKIVNLNLNSDITSNNVKDVFSSLPISSPFVNIDPKSLSMYQNKIKLQEIKKALIGINANQENLYSYNEVDVNNIGILKNKLLEAERNDITDKEIKDIRNYINSIERIILKEHYFTNDNNYSENLENEILHLSNSIYNLIEKPSVLNDFRFNRDKTQPELDEILKSGGLSIHAKTLLNTYNLERLDK